MSIDPSRPEQVAPALLEYLRGHLGVTERRFAEAPEPRPATEAAIKKGTVERVPAGLASELQRYFWKQTRA